MWEKHDEGELGGCYHTRMEGLFCGSSTHRLEESTKLKNYWQKKAYVVHCPMISLIMSRVHFEALTRCLQVTNLANHVHIK